ncbi:CAMK/CAMKL/AMPK protein kinase [Pelomyxa schiedti]|nr:CAMK/CAMKL/AMPK protein kinase [Pelomyxa schiedti]
MKGRASGGTSSRRSVTPNNLPPKKVGNYLIGRTLGEGTFGKVKYAENLTTGERVAIKISDKQKLLKQGMTVQLRREISIMKMIRHPNIVNLIEVLVSKTKIYLVSELALGGELFYKLAQEGKFSEARARIYFQQLISAVEYCHAQGICHRDIKPENLLLAEDGETLKLSDFGLSTIFSDPTENGFQARLLRTQCGTPNYVSPEILEGSGYQGTTADVWSCGVVLFVLLAGYLPFKEESVTALFKKIQSASFKFPPWFTDGPKDLLRNILVADPRARFTIPQIKQSGWFRSGGVFFPEEGVAMIDMDTPVEPWVPVSDDEHPTPLPVQQANQAPSTTNIPMYHILSPFCTNDHFKHSTNAFTLISLSGAFDLHKLSGTTPDASVVGGRFCRFFSREPPDAILKHLQIVLTAMNVTFEINEAACKIRVGAQDREGHAVGLVIEILLLVDDIYLVMFRKTHGDMLIYHHLYQLISNSCTSIMDTTHSGAFGAPSSRYTTPALTTSPSTQYHGASIRSISISATPKLSLPSPSLSPSPSPLPTQLLTYATSTNPSRSPNLHPVQHLPPLHIPPPATLNLPLTPLSPHSPTSNSTQTNNPGTSNPRTSSPRTSTSPRPASHSPTLAPINMPPSTTLVPPQKTSTSPRGLSPLPNTKVPAVPAIPSLPPPINDPASWPQPLLSPKSPKSLAPLLSPSVYSTVTSTSDAAELSNITPDTYSSPPLTPVLPGVTPFSSSNCNPANAKSSPVCIQTARTSHEHNKYSHYFHQGSGTISSIHPPSPYASYNLNSNSLLQPPVSSYHQQLLRSQSQESGLPTSQSTPIIYDLETRHSTDELASLFS